MRHFFKVAASESAPNLRHFFLFRVADAADRNAAVYGWRPVGDQLKGGAFNFGRKFERCQTFSDIVGPLTIFLVQLRRVKAV